ncbi:IS66 family insertion sequence element accessory protein TnpA [Clostridioides difficile]|uniref:IS66 family insertion sequence element accessory protein TnpA n=1 Tax=Clostridioides difficile TaxID=1496 RepID=UPI002928A7F3|nr:transposase [Clostridioides difficile]
MRQHYKHYSNDEKKRLILECRQSGLSDYQWCHQNGINNSTFYNWVKKLRDVACQDTLTEPVSSNQVKPISQDVVKVNVIPKNDLISVSNPRILATDTTESASIELILNECNIKIHNNADPALLAYTINLLRGVL